MTSLKENVERIREEIARKATNREVRLLGVTKAQPAGRVIEAVEAGLRLLGNNYVQEGDSLRGRLAERGVEWHFIGHIQSRKAKDVVAYDCIESLDRWSVAEELSRRAVASGKRLPVLVEVNVGGEASKSGVSLDEVEGFLARVAGLPGLKLDGLMAMPPPLEPIESRRPYFHRMRQLFERNSERLGFRCLSMGTSDDYAIAVEEGSTLVRLGTALFGPRSR